MGCAPVKEDQPEPLADPPGAEPAACAELLQEDLKAQAEAQEALKAQASAAQAEARSLGEQLLTEQVKTVKLTHANQEAEAERTARRGLVTALEAKEQEMKTLKKQFQSVQARARVAETRTVELRQELRQQQRPNALAEAMEQEANSRGSESPSCGPPQSMAATADPAHYRPYPESEYLEISPSSGELVMNLHDRMHNTPPDEIIPGFMWLGAERGAICPNCPPFSHVLFATNKPTSPYPARHYLCIELADDPDTDLAARFAESNEFIAKAHKQKGSKLLIHCRMGQSRSSTLVAAYLMWHYRCSLRDALVWTKERRRIIAPNTGFFIQMQQYEKELFGVQRSSISRDQARKLGLCSVGKGPDGL